MSDHSYNSHMANEVTDSTGGVLKAIKWLEQTGRSIIAAKMERELLRADQHKLEKGAFPSVESLHHTRS